MELSWQAGGLSEASWSALGGLRGRKKDPSSGSWALQKGMSRQVSTILGPKRLPKRSPGGSKMGSQIESGLKKAKSQKMQHLWHENLNLEGPGPPKRIQNWFPISSSTREPSKSLLRASWSALGAPWSQKIVVLDSSLAVLQEF